MRRSTRTTFPSDVSARAISKRAIERARATQCLHPHELLRYWANGVSIGGLTPDPDQQLAAAIASAPYYAPKLANIEVRQETHVRAVISAQPMTIGAWSAKYIAPAPSLLHENLNTNSVQLVDNTNPPSLETSPETTHSPDNVLTPRKD